MPIVFSQWLTDNKELDQNFISKKRGIISAVQISSRISALARKTKHKRW